MPQMTHTLVKPDEKSNPPCSSCGGDTKGGVCTDTTCEIHAQ